MFKGTFLFIAFAVAGTMAQAEVTVHFDPFKQSGWMNHFESTGKVATTVTYHPAPTGCACGPHCTALVSPARPEVWPRQYPTGIEFAQNSGGIITAEMIEGIPAHSGSHAGSNEGRIHPTMQVCALLID